LLVTVRRAAPTVPAHQWREPATVEPIWMSVITLPQTPRPASTGDDRTRTGPRETRGKISVEEVTSYFAHEGRRAVLAYQGTKGQIQGTESRSARTSSRRA
jgi:hypothetical protein